MKIHAYKTIKAADLKPAAANPRTHSQQQIEQLRRSIREFGFTNPLLIDEHGSIIAGHGRLLAAQAEGLDELPAIEIRGLSDAQKRALVIADNQLALNAGWDSDILASELQSLQSSEFDLSLLGFSARELQNFSGFGSEIAAAEPIYGDAEIVEAAFEHFSRSGFPYPSKALHEQMQEINALRQTATDDLLHSATGYSVADHYHGHRFSARAGNRKTPVEGFAEPARLRKFLAFVVKHANIPAGYFGQIQLMTGVQVRSNFRPGFAAYMYRRFCPAGGAVLDTSTGFGGRLIGAIGSGTVAQYSGIDPNSLTHAANDRMMRELGAPIDFQLINEPAEDVSLDQLPFAPFDFAFTSPPYFTKEIYSNEGTQSSARYPQPEAWRAGFLAKMLQLQFAALKRGAFNAVNIEDVKIGSHKIPLVDWTKAEGIAAGFAFDRMEAFPIPSSNWVSAEQKADRFEHVLIFKKP